MPFAESRAIRHDSVGAAIGLGSADDLAQLFGDPLLASATMDRLLHGAHVLRLVGGTYRNPPPARRPKRENSSTLEATP